MSGKRFLILMISILGSTYLPAQDVVNDDESSSYNLNKPEREEWLRNTNNGMFIHFSVDAPLGIVISHSLVGASADYVNRYFTELPQVFNPARFNPDEIAALAKLAGMKYIMFTTKHHSGFCMWDTKTTDFNIMHTPYHKDLLKEWVEATRRAGLQVGFYFSPEDFHFLHRHHLPISRDNVVMNEEVQQAWTDFTRRQCEELMTNYGKIDLLFIDGEPKEIVKETCWKLQPDILITRGALKTPEQMLPGVTITDPWLSCITMGTAWQYQPTNDRYKSGRQLIELLIEARSKGGSLLLNIGPKPNGEMAQEQEDRLREMAAWYFVNREAVDSVRPWVITNENNNWFTASIDKKTVYAFVTDAAAWKEGDRKSLVFHSIKSTAATRISVLGQNSLIQEYRPGKDVGCKYQQTDTGLVVSVVKAQRLYDDHRWPNPVVIKIEQVEPAIQPVQVQTVSAKTTAATVLLQGKVLNYKGDAAMKAGFWYRVYNGQTEDLYAGPWIKTRAVKPTADGSFTVTIGGLKKGQKYEYKAVVEYNRISFNGDEKVWQQ
ncbi:alpha-L-fucosidase [Pseudoflavitalea sp. X16]|uniref:alpha-L-fucosidase n=1 Tax=Paraflavitalea devenefica TaxID=2716334 RepID=UPI001420F8E9|nr:alpha-L-fucosidase [Paraflavitalea devenefica]NII26265.1 alpha-L-fucosidase [Paraflavitalea devenefica]